MKCFVLVKFFCQMSSYKNFKSFLQTNGGMLKIVAELAACSNESLEILHSIGITRFRAFRRLEAAVFLKQKV